MREVVIIFVGSGAGGILRHIVGQAALKILGPSFPYGTLIVNVLGSALMGLVVGWLLARSSTSNEVRLFVATGLIGGFTTWSTFVLDAVTLWERRQPLAAFGYLAGSLLLSFVIISAVLVIVRK